MFDEKKGKESNNFNGDGTEKKDAPDIYEYEKQSGVQYSKTGQKKPRRYKSYWRKLMDSTQKKMSIGASKIARMLSWARGDNWRRGGEGSREHRKPGKK